MRLDNDRIRSKVARRRPFWVRGPGLRRPHWGGPSPSLRRGASGRGVPGTTAGAARTNTGCTSCAPLRIPDHILGFSVRWVCAPPRSIGSACAPLRPPYFGSVGPVPDAFARGFAASRLATVSSARSSGQHQASCSVCVCVCLCEGSAAMPAPSPIFYGLHDRGHNPLRGPKRSIQRPWPRARKRRGGSPLRFATMQRGFSPRSNAGFRHAQMKQILTQNTPTCPHILHAFQHRSISFAIDQNLGENKPSRPPPNNRQRVAPPRVRRGCWAQLAHVHACQCARMYVCSVCLCFNETDDEHCD